MPAQQLAMYPVSQADNGFPFSGLDLGLPRIFSLAGSIWPQNPVSAGGSLNSRVGIQGSIQLRFLLFYPFQIPAQTLGPSWSALHLLNAKRLL